MSPNLMAETPAARKRARAGAWVIAGTSLLLNTACYSYLPPPGGTLPAEGDVQVELTADGSAMMQPVIGPRIHLVEGSVRAIDAEGNPTINIEQLTSWEGLTLPYAGRDPVRIPRSGIARADVRTLDRKRSWVAGGVVGGVFVVAVISALLKARSRASGGPGKITASPPDLRAP
jgi:hypothetical protein